MLCFFILQDMWLNNRILKRLASGIEEDKDEEDTDDTDDNID